MGRKEQTKPKANRRKEIIQMSVEINEIEKRKLEKKAENLSGFICNAKWFGFKLKGNGGHGKTCC